MWGLEVRSLGSVVWGLDVRGLGSVVWKVRR